MKIEPATQHSKREPGMQLLMILCILMPLMILFLLPTGGLLGGGVYFFLGLLLCFWLISMLSGTFTAAQANLPLLPPTARGLADSEQLASIKELMDVWLAEEDNGVRIFHGRLREPAATVYV